MLFNLHLWVHGNNVGGVEIGDVDCEVYACHYPGGNKGSITAGKYMVEYRFQVV